MDARLVTDNLQDEAVIAHALRLAGFKTRISATVNEFAENWSREPGDLVVVALGRETHRGDLAALVREIRQHAIVPLIVIGEMVTEDEQVATVDAGADLLLTRPVSIRLLMAYAKALLRRVSMVNRDTLPTLRYDRVQLNPANRTVTMDGAAPQRLSQLEYRLLHTLMLHQGQILPTETIVEHVWGYDGDGDRRLVRGLVNRLRTKIEPNPNQPRYIRTVPRIGDLFGEEPD